MILSANEIRITIWKYVAEFHQVFIFSPIENIYKSWHHVGLHFQE